MTRPTPTDIDPGDNGWDSVFNDIAAIVRDGPFPIHEHSGDETDLASTFTAATHDRCFVWVDHTVMGWTLYWSDGSSWLIFPGNRVVGPSYRTVSANTTLTNDDDVVMVSNNNALTITLPASPTPTGRVIWVGTIGSSATITIAGNGNNVNGAANYSLAGAASYRFAQLFWTGSEWLVLANDKNAT